jgi:hypothetical protein
MTAQLLLSVHEPDDVEALSHRLDASWPNIMAARQRSRSRLEELDALVQAIIPIGTSLVVYGSLARLEYTSGSDLDWTLLLDCAANPQHQLAELEIKRAIGGRFKAPNAAGAFGGLTFSHDLVHKIGGDDDTNINTTQRMLLLLESIPVGDQTSYENVLRNVLRRYIEEDYLAPGDSPFRVPRFLVNDLARYWRTIAVDFAQKRRQQAGEGWALRTFKLRLSRKLIYAAGLISCFTCQNRPTDVDERYAQKMVLSHLERVLRKPPLDILASSALTYFGECSALVGGVFQAYDDFLGVLDDTEKRGRLKSLPPKKESDPIYAEAHEIGSRFGDILNTLFFETTTFSALTRRFGVF